MFVAFYTLCGLLVMKRDSRSFFLFDHFGCEAEIPIDV